MKNFKIIKKFSVPSTQSETEKYVGIYDNVAVIAKRQTKGRGRNGRTFVSPLGGFYMSARVSCKKAATKSTLFVLYSGLAVMRALSNQGIETKLKFPNDVKYNGKKLCGIICSSTLSGGLVTGATVGIGINVKNKIPKELEDKAISLKGKRIDKNKLAEDILGYLYDMISLEEDKDALLKEYKNASETLGNFVTVDCVPKISGKAIDIDENGFLLVEEESGEIKKVSYGDVTRSQ